ncbi:CocE/NonD family hydrolase [Bdellovibrio sp. GT3]
MWPFKSVLVIAGTLLVATVSSANPLSRVCPFVLEGFKSPPQPQGAALPPSAIPKGDEQKVLTEVCKAPQVFLSLGQIQAFRNGNSYAFFLLGRDKQIREASYQATDQKFSIRQSIVTMADGVQIPTYLVTKSTATATPNHTILIRSPYLASNLSVWIESVQIALRGVNVVFQPARGTFLAGGEFEWLDWKQEAKDGKATLDWIVQQPWSNKKVYALGTSYDAFLAMAAGTTRHPNLLAVFAASGPWNPSTDSLSGAGYFGPSLNYVAALNWDGGERNAIEKINSKMRYRSYSKTLEKSRAIYGLKLKSLSPTELQKNSEDFIESLKKATATMIYGYGIQNDQDSRDVINLRPKLAGHNNHFFLAHNEGHSHDPLKSLLFYLLANGDTTPGKITPWLRENILNKQFCIFTEQISCQDDMSPFTPTIPHVTQIPNAEINGTDLYRAKVMENSETYLFGQRHIKFEVEVPETAPELVLRSYTYVCEAPQTCAAISPEATNHTIMVAGLKKGTHQYAISSQHEYFKIPAGTVYISFGLVDKFGKRMPVDPKVKIRNIEYTLPVMAD